MKWIAAITVALAGLFLFVGLPEHKDQVPASQSDKLRQLAMTTDALNAGTAGRYVEACQLYRRLLAENAELEDSSKTLLERDCARTSR